MRPQTDAESSSGRLGTLARLFGRLGVVAFGGPAAHIAMMHDEVVERRGWITDQRFVDMIGATSLIPGPNSTEMTMHVGHVRAGWRGLIVAGTCFITPAVAMVLALAWTYVRYGDTPSGEALLYGVKPVVIAIIVKALVKLARTAIDSVWLGAVAVGVAGGYLVGVNELVLLAAGAGLVVATGAARRSVGPMGGVLASLTVPTVAGRLALQVGSDEVGLTRLFGVFAKIGAVLYGSGYVLVAFLRTDLVTRLDVLTNQQLLDAVAVGQFTPGPVFTTATFIGYVLGGFSGAAVATVGIFLPSFLFVGALSRILPHIRDRWWSAALLDGVNAAALGLMVGVLVLLGGDALIDPITIGIAAATGLVLWRSELSSVWLVAGGAGAGLMTNAVGLG